MISLRVLRELRVKLSGEGNCFLIAHSLDGVVNYSRSAEFPGGGVRNIFRQAKQSGLK